MLVDLARHHARSIVLGILVICGGTVSTYVFNYMTTYAITTLHLSAAIGTTLTLMGSPAQIAGFALGVWLDRFGRKRLLVLSRLLFLADRVSGVHNHHVARCDGRRHRRHQHDAELHVRSRHRADVAFLSEAFPQSVRSSGLGIVYALGVTIFGGSTQFVVAWLIDATKNPMIPAWYQIAANIVAIIGVVLMSSHSGDGGGWRPSDSTRAAIPRHRAARET